MRLEDFQRKVFDKVLGLYSRGRTDQVPENYFSDCLNIDYEIGEWKTRSGLSTVMTSTLSSAGNNILRFACFSDPVIGPIVLFLDDTGRFYTYSARALDTGQNSRFTVAGVTDFSAIKMFGRIYIACHDGQFGSAVNLRVFIPHATVIANDEFRDAAGLAPINSAIVAVDGVAGLVNAGTYKIAVIYQTTSGFQTQPGPKVATVFTPTSYVAPGSKKISLTNLPIGPAGTSKRQILITKAGLEEYFFLPSAYGGLINDNTTTTATLNFDDTTDLVDSADYLFDLLETIPSPLVLQDYNAKLCTAGEASIPSIIRVSRNGEPEAFDSISGIVTVNKDDGYTVRNLSIVRDVLYAWKNLGVYSIRDNGDDASTWSVNAIDQTVNVGIHGISEFFDVSGIRMSRDWTLVADKSGIVLFDGIVRKPPITDNINDIWQSINFTYFHKVVLVVDEQNHKIYCAIPTGVATSNNKLLMADYNLCAGKIPDVGKIKWSIWSSSLGANPVEIGMFGIGSDTVPTLKFALANGIYRLDSSVTTEGGFAIVSYFETALIYWEEGNIHFFTAARLRVVADSGTPTILCTISGEDSVDTGTLPSIVLTTSPGKEYLIRFNFQNEKAKMKFRMTSGRFVVSKLEVFGKPVYTMRPA